jgi:hypothetical protein
MRPVHNPHLCTGSLPTEHGSTMQVHAVFPIVHTPYYFYKDLLND